MIDKFLALPTEKQERILNAAMRQFAMNGYDRASTNEMVKDAGISKGLLFHYFKNKQELFFYVYDYSVDRMMSDFSGQSEQLSPDITERWKQLLMVKLEMQQRHPEIFQFLKTASEDDSSLVKQGLHERIQAIYKDAFEWVYGGLDYSLFRDDVDQQRALQIIIWMLEGYGNQVREQLLSMPLDEVKSSAIYMEFERYLDVLKQAFYK